MLLVLQALSFFERLTTSFMTLQASSVAPSLAEFRLRVGSLLTRRFHLSNPKATKSDRRLYSVLLKPDQYARAIEQILDLYVSRLFAQEHRSNFHAFNQVPCASIGLPVPTGNAIEVQP
ncbi:hypothetical protein AVEN_153496-1 [Araneus ventricosus]|uniref:Uncharacterized protein n=1 Tax=Araneus ventricosus TaxID=182803 RepID=A0A4Y2K464_ARAVE|nr:hypothetical protein AVEN_153496-1 [Araneus ventricosus]